MYKVSYEGLTSILQNTNNDQDLELGFSASVVDY